MVSPKSAKMLNQTIFVTGASGFIGQRLVDNLNGEIKILSRKPHLEYKTVVCDLQSEAIPDDALDDVDTVFHLAGFTHDLRDDSKLEHLYRALNVDATVRLIELAVRSGVKQFVFVSSAKAGGQNELVNSEPEGIYGKTKREAEVKILEIGLQSDMHVSIVRPSLVYGHGVKGNLALMRKGIECGWFPPLPETCNRRSMIHVDDLVEVLLFISKDERANGEIFVATDGTPHSSRDIYEAICHTIGKPVPQWSVPKFLFKWVSLVSPQVRYKFDKLLGDEYYSSEKLGKLGFRAEKSLLDFDR
jgi:UDP-glucose 4-epimerase